MGTIITSEAKCRDCYKCIRHCPVKATGMKEDQSWVIEEKCILCGECIAICPQNAKSTLSALAQFEGLLDNKEKVAVSLAPSYLAATGYSSPWKLVAALRQIGVGIIEETALGAELVSLQYQSLYLKKEQECLISSCCPAVVSLVKKHYPQLLTYLAPLISPMLIHGKSLKERLGPEWKVVFIGPCFAKKEEALADQSLPVDLVLTFEELTAYFSELQLDPERLTDAFPDTVSGTARSYPLPRGILALSGIEDAITADVTTVDGLEEVLTLFDDIKRGDVTPRFIEAMACKGGCIGGTAIDSSLGLAARKKRLLNFLAQRTDAITGNKDKMAKISLAKKHVKVRQKDFPLPSAEEIRKILALTGKFTAEDETDCGGCGYHSCRDKAIAVYQGLAEPKMCVPYMRARAESLSHAVVDSSMNAVIIVDEEMIIQEFNPAANQMLNRKGVKAKGRHISAFVDPADYLYVWQQKKRIVDKYKEYREYGLITRENIYPLEKYGVIIAIMTDVTEEERRKTEIDNMKQGALERAKRVIREQMKVAQEIASLLGESTAETKSTLLELVEIMNEKEARTGEDKS